MKKMSKFLGVLLSTFLVVSMFAIATPVTAADPGNIEWESQSLPGSGMMELDSDVIDIAAANDGSTIYVADPEGGKMFKSTNAGQSFSALDEYVDYGAGTPISIAVAPDDEDQIAVVDTTGMIYTSGDAGNSWSELPPISGTNALAVDVAIGPSRSGTALGREYFVAVVDTMPGTTDGDVLTIGDTLTWVSVSDDDVSGDYDCVAVAVSPGYLGDRVVVAIGASTTAGAKCLFLKVDTSNPGEGELVKSATLDPDDYTPATLDYGAASDDILWGDIALPNDFDPTSSSGRVAFVGIVSNATDDQDVYRVEDDDAYDLDLDEPISSVSYAGTIDEGMLFAGEFGDNVVQATDEVDDNSPDWDDESVIGEDITIVRVASDYVDSQTVYAGTSGDKSAFSISVDGGKYYGESQIDNDEANNVIYVENIAITPDAETIFMSTNGTCGCFSLWRSSLPSSGTSWSLIKEIDEGSDDWDGTLLAINPNFEDDPVVIWAVQDEDKAGAPMYVSQNGGDSFSTKTGPGDNEPVRAIAIEDDQTFYAGCDKYIYKTTNNAWYWEEPVDAKAGDINNIVVPVADWVLVGGTNEVSYSDDGGESFEDENENLDEGHYIVAPHEDFVDNMLMFASANGTYRFEIEEDNEWHDINGDDWYSAIGLAQFNDTLYRIGSHYWDGEFQRSINPTTTTPGSVAWQDLMEGDDIDLVTSFQAIEVDGENIIYASGLNDGDPKIWAYNDWLATTAPELVSPPNNYELAIDPVNGRGLPVDLVWEQMGNGSGMVLYYDVQITDASAGWSGAPVQDNIKVSGTNPTINTLEDIDYTFLANKNYLWRVRAYETSNGETTRSPWSDAYTIKVQSGTVVNQPYAGPILTGPAGGAQDVNPNLVGFSWASVPGATSYQIIVATDSALTATVGGTPATVTGTSYQVTGLDEGTTYFWAVMAVEPTVSPQNTGTFTTMTSAPPPVTVEPQPTPTIIMPSAQTPAYIWAVIVIGAVLVIAVIILIVRTRRVS
jgi:hypothetical protein